MNPNQDHLPAFSVWDNVIEMGGRYHRGRVIPSRSVRWLNPFYSLYSETTAWCGSSIGFSSDEDDDNDSFFDEMANRRMASSIPTSPPAYAAASFDATPTVLPLQ